MDNKRPPIVDKTPTWWGWGTFISQLHVGARYGSTYLKQTYDLGSSYFILGAFHQIKAPTQKTQGLCVILVRFIEPIIFHNLPLCSQVQALRLKKRVSCSGGDRDSKASYDVGPVLEGKPIVIFFNASRGLGAPRIQDWISSPSPPGWGGSQIGPQPPPLFSPGTQGANPLKTSPKLLRSFTALYR